MRNTMIATLGVAGWIAMVGVAHAETLRDRCDMRARDISGYTQGKLPAFKIGPFTGRISGSVAIGVGRSSGPQVHKAPPFAGSYSVERREAGKAEHYDRVLADCMAEG